MFSMLKSGVALAATALLAGGLVAGPAQAQAEATTLPNVSAQPKVMSLFGNWRPWWDPTKVIESDPEPGHSEGSIENVTYTADADGGKTLRAGDGRAYGRVTAEGVGFTPGMYYTVRITLREAGTGEDWGVYTWLTYRATEEGKIHINLRVMSPSRSHPGERIVAAPAIYSADDIRQDGRPHKADKTCILNCKRVAPLARYTDYNNPESIITYK